MTEAQAQGWTNAPGQAVETPLTVNVEDVRCATCGEAIAGAPSECPGFEGPGAFPPHRWLSLMSMEMSDAEAAAWLTNPEAEALALPQALTVVCQFCGVSVEDADAACPERGASDPTSPRSSDRPREEDEEGSRRVKITFYTFEGKELGKIELVAGKLVYDDWSRFIAEFKTPGPDGEMIDPLKDPELFLRALPRHFRNQYAVPALEGAEPIGINPAVLARSRHATPTEPTPAEPAEGRAE